MAKIYETGGYQIKEKIHLPVTLPSSLFNTQFSFYYHLTIIPENEMVKLEKEKKITCRYVEHVDWKEKE